MTENEISKVIVDAAIEAHRELGGPGLIESVYEEAMVEEPMAEAAMTDETMAADQAPDHMPVTGGESNNGLNMALIAALVVFLLGALAVASRRRVA